MIHKIPTANREEWLALRKNYIGGSDAGAVAGLNPYASPLSTWMEKTGKAPEFQGNVTTKVGSYLEDLVAMMFMEETGLRVRRENRSILNDDYPWAIADIDRAIIGHPWLLECKTSTSLPVSKTVKGMGKPVDAHLAQVMHYMAVTGYQRAYIAYLLNNRDFHIVTVDRDEDEIAALMAIEKDFWACVKSDTPPAPIGQESDDEALQTLYPDSDGSTVNLFGRGTDLDMYQALSQQIKDLQAQQDAIAQRIKGDMGPAETATCDGWKVSWKSVTSSRIDSKRLKADLPEIAARYSKESTSRRFTISKV